MSEASNPSSRSKSTVGNAAILELARLQDLARSIELYEADVLAAARRAFDLPDSISAYGRRVVEATDRNASADV